MIRVLDVLSEPVLCPVDLFTADGCLLILQYHPELVVFHQMVHTVVGGNFTEPLLFEVEVKPHVVLESLQKAFVSWVLGHSQDVCEEDVVFFVKSCIISFE